MLSFSFHYRVLIVCYLLEKFSSLQGQGEVKEQGSTVTSRPPSWDKVPPSLSQALLIPPALVLPHDLQESKSGVVPEISHRMTLAEVSVLGKKINCGNQPADVARVCLHTNSTTFKMAALCLHTDLIQDGVINNPSFLWLSSRNCSCLLWLS